MKGNIFGGFTPLKWKSRTPNSWEDSSNYLKADNSLKSFLFTLKNPHNIPARRFPLKAEKKHLAINCHSKRGPCFVDISWDLGVSDHCNANSSYTWLGSSYTNDTKLYGQIVFTYSKNFQVAEIEVFEIAASTALRSNRFFLRTRK
jgi:hypothetical protein